MTYLRELQRATQYHTTESGHKILRTVMSKPIEGDILNEGDVPIMLDPIHLRTVDFFCNKHWVEDNHPGQNNHQSQQTKKSLFSRIYKLGSYLFSR